MLSRRMIKMTSLIKILKPAQFFFFAQISQNKGIPPALSDTSNIFATRQKKQRERLRERERKNSTGHFSFAAIILYEIYFMSTINLKKRKIFMAVHLSIGSKKNLLSFFRNSLLLPPEGFLIRLPSCTIG